MPKSSSLPGSSIASSDASKPSSGASKASPGGRSSSPLAGGASNASCSSAGTSSKRLRGFGWTGGAASESSAIGSSIESSSPIGSSGLSKASVLPSSESSVIATGSSAGMSSAVGSPCTVFGSHGSSTEEAGASAGLGWAAVAASPDVVVAAWLGSSSGVGLSASGVVSVRGVDATGRPVEMGPPFPVRGGSAGVGVSESGSRSITVPYDSPSTMIGACVPVTPSSTTTSLPTTPPSWQGSQTQSEADPSMTHSSTIDPSTIDPSTGPVVTHSPTTTAVGTAIWTANGEGAPSGRSSMTIAPAQPGNGAPMPHGGGKAGPQTTGEA